MRINLLPTDVKSAIIQDITKPHYRNAYRIVTLVEVEMPTILSLKLFSNLILTIFFFLGDSRANDQPTVITLYTLFAREHNRVAKTLAFINPTWNDEKLFQEARKIVIAELQHIVYNEYLPVILGTNIMNTYGLTLKSTGYKNDYSNHTNPVIRGAFTSVMDMTIATLSRATFNANGRSNKLSSSYQNPSVFYKNLNAVDSIVGEMLKEKSQKFDR